MCTNHMTAAIHLPHRIFYHYDEAVEVVYTNTYDT